MPDSSLEWLLIKTVLLALAPLLCFLCLGKGDFHANKRVTCHKQGPHGAKHEEHSHQKGRVTPWLVYSLAAACVVGAFSLFSSAANSLPAHPLWTGLVFIVLCFATGVFEEVFFRGVLFEALLAGIDKNALRISLALSCILFALFHLKDFAPDATLGTALNVLCLILKFTQAALFGFFMAAVYLRTKSLWPCIITHALADICLLAPQLLETGTLLGNTLTSTSFEVLGLALCVVLFMPLAFIARTWIKQVPLPRCSLFKATPEEPEPRD